MLNLPYKVFQDSATDRPQEQEPASDATDVLGPFRTATSPIALPQGLRSCGERLARRRELGGKFLASPSRINSKYGARTVQQ